jgi:DNA-binding protein HU-beta
MAKDIQCAYVYPPRCPNLVKGKGLYCPDHQPSPGDINKVMNKSHVVAYCAQLSGLKKAQVKELFSDLSSLAAKEIQLHGEFTVPGFGKLVMKERRGRQGKNPATGETIKIPARTRLKFRVGKTAKDSMLSRKSIKRSERKGLAGRQGFEPR